MIVLKAAQANLLEALQSVSGIVERRHTLPILANVLMRKNGGTVEFTTSDLEIQVRTQAELGGDEGQLNTTVLHAVRKIGAERTVNPELNQQLHVLEQTLKG